MLNDSIYINSLPSKDNNPRGKLYNNNFLHTLNDKSNNKLKIYINKNDRHRDYKFKDFAWNNAKKFFNLVEIIKKEEFFNNTKDAFVNLMSHQKLLVMYVNLKQDSDWLRIRSVFKQISYPRLMTWFIN